MKRFPKSEFSDSGIAPKWRKSGIVWFDRIVVVGLVLLVGFSPLAIGSVNPWAYGAAEGLVFFLTAVWMARLAIGNEVPRLPGLLTLLTPASLMLGLAVFQL